MASLDNLDNHTDCHLKFFFGQSRCRGHVCEVLELSAPWPGFCGFRDFLMESPWGIIFGNPGSWGLRGRPVLWATGIMLHLFTWQPAENLMITLRGQDPRTFLGFPLLRCVRGGDGRLWWTNSYKSGRLKFVWPSSRFHDVMWFLDPHLAVTDKLDRFSPSYC